MANTTIYVEEWTERLQETLDAPTFWKQVARVDFTTSQVLHNPYQDKASASSYTRGNQYSFSDFTLTDDKVTINDDFVIPEFIDEADRDQIGFDMQMERAQRQGEEINLTVESQMLGDHANWTNIDNTDLGGTGDISLSSTNVDDVVRVIKQKIYENNGGQMYARNGGFVIWDPQAFELVESFAMANGFQTQDDALRGGVDGVQGFNFMGLTHYVSNSLTTASNTLHVFAGVKQMYHIGILSTVFGRIKIDEEPNRQNGVGIISRLTMKGKVWNNLKPLLFDVNIDRS